MIKTKSWICIFSILLALSLIAAGILYSSQPKSSVVQILQDGKLVKEIDLSQVEAPYSFTVTDPHGGSNRIQVEPGRICVLEADCPVQVCVHRGWLRDSAAPIVCIPHRLVIQMGGEAQVDTVVK